MDMTGAYCYQPVMKNKELKVYLRRLVLLRTLDLILVVFLKKTNTMAIWTDPVWIYMYINTQKMNQDIYILGLQGVGGKTGQ